MALHGSEPNGDGVEISGRRKRDAGWAVANLNRACLLGVAAVLLVRFNGDAVRTRRDWPLVVVQAIPHQLVLARRPRRARDRAELIEVAVEVIPERREVAPVFGLAAPQREA